jgi:hypothetical protein
MGIRLERQNRKIQLTTRGRSVESVWWLRAAKKDKIALVPIVVLCSSSVAGPLWSLGARWAGLDRHALANPLLPLSKLFYS